eukprot:2854564-Pyramimonas_sp.AAC.1
MRRALRCCTARCKALLDAGCSTCAILTARGQPGWHGLRSMHWSGWPALATPPSARRPSSGLGPLGCGPSRT